MGASLIPCPECTTAGEVPTGHDELETWVPCPVCQGEAWIASEPHLPTDDDIERLTAEYDAMIEEQEAAEGLRILDEVA